MKAYILLMAIGLGGCAAGKPPALACTMEARACPDGSYVGRDPHNGCRFRACPN
jgi:hypothetical protein